MKLIPKFWKSWRWLVASVGLVLPEVLGLIAEHSALIPDIAPDYKDAIRLTCLVLIVMLRPIRQKALEPQ